jgi:hypothetical protein
MRAHRKALLALIPFAAAWAQDPRELVRLSIAQDQLDWVRMKDYTWQANSLERHFDSRGKVEFTRREVWETLVLDGQPHRRTLERDGKPLSPEEQRSEQKKLDQAFRKLSSETPAEKQRRQEEAEKSRKREFAFLSEIPDLFDLRLEGESTVDGRPVWVVSGAPRPGAKPKSRDAKMLLKVRGRMWIDKATHQWAKVEAETTDTISWGLFLARLNSGAKLTFEQTEVSSDLWLPKRLFLTGSGRVGLVKRLAQDQEIQWSNYKKFSVDSKIVTDPRAGPKN